ncbi:hypothetical protein LB503_007882 [Fusarium chuoi]|nr:hypothetical protein LB503_007882 [Fusarium chuoi]
MEQYQQTATGTARHALQLPDQDSDNTVVNLDLTGENMEFPTKIGELIRRERHADVYSVCWDDPSIRYMGFEARAFIIDQVSGKLKRHRKRCIQRLGPRTLLNVSCRGAEVIVYTANRNDWLVAAEGDKDSNETCQTVLGTSGGK